MENKMYTSRSLVPNLHPLNDKKKRSDIIFGLKTLRLLSFG